MNSVTNSVPVGRFPGWSRWLSDITLGEAAVGALLAGALWLPVFVGSLGWRVGFVLLLVAAGYRIVQTRRLPAGTFALGLYAAAYVPAFFRGGAAAGTDIVDYFGRPLIALAVATVVTTATQRKRVLALLVVMLLVEVPVVVSQALQLLLPAGAKAPGIADSITGTFGDYQSDTMALAVLVATAVVACAWLAGALRGVFAAVIVVALLSVPVLASARAQVGLVVVVALAIVVGTASTRRRPRALRILALAAGSCGAAAALYFGMQALYPGSWIGLWQAQNSTVLGGAAAYGAPATNTVASPGCSGHATVFRNGDFHLGSSGGPSTAAVAADPSRRFAGKASFRVTANGSSSLSSDFVGVCLGDEYTASAEVLAPPGRKISIALLNGGEAVTHTLTGAGAWQRVSASLRTDVSSAAIAFTSIGTPKTTFWLSDVALKRGASAAAPCRVPPTQNLMPNGDFQRNLVGWSTVGPASVSRDTTKAKVGGVSARIEANRRLPDEGIGTWVNGTCAGEAYTASAWIWAPRNVRFQIVIGDRTAPGVAAQELPANAVGTGRWQHVQVSRRSVESSLYVEITPIGVIQTTIWVDGVRLVRQAPLEALQSSVVAPSTSPAPSGASASSAPSAVGVQLLPGRLHQLRLALHLSLHSGFAAALFGNGIGASDLNPSYTNAYEVPPTERTGTTWLGKILTETGWIGVLAFTGLIGWLVLIGRRLWRESGAGTGDRTLGALLPGLAALTFAGGAYVLVLDVRGYAVVFWVLVGLALSAVADRDPVSSPSTGS